MTKHIACVVSGCAFEDEAATEAELVERVKAHAVKDHGVAEFTPELAARVKAAIVSR
jgi:predicted small metal-binding protein